MILGDRPRQWLVGIGVVLIFALLGTSVYQQYQNGQQAQDFNATSVRQNDEIIALLHNHSKEIDEIKSAQGETQALEAQLSTLVDQIHAEVPLITGSLVNGQNVLIAQYNEIVAKLNALCAKSGACGQTPQAPLNPLPALPSHASTTTQPPKGGPVATTTTQPKHHKRHRK